MKYGDSSIGGHVPCGMRVWLAHKIASSRSVSDVSVSAAVNASAARVASPAVPSPCIQNRLGQPMSNTSVISARLEVGFASEREFVAQPGPVPRPSVGSSHLSRSLPLARPISLSLTHSRGFHTELEPWALSSFASRFVPPRAVKQREQRVLSTAATEPSVSLPRWVEGAGGRGAGA